MWQQRDLAYCSNVHPAATLAGVQRDTLAAVAAVRECRGLAEMAAGLWLSAEAAAALDRDADALEAFAAALNGAGLRLVTLNGFPYGDFHGPALKQRVYRPDWAQPARAEYTLRLARILAACLPADVASGSISTLPLGFARDWDADRQLAALVALCGLAADLAALQQQTGRTIRVCLEMEPACVLERTDQAIDLFIRQLPATAAALGIPAGTLQAHLGICFDVCHQAVMFESPGESLTRLVDAGIAIGKIQVSSALELRAPAAGDPADALGAFAEPRFLHQVLTLDRDGRAYGVLDLPEALAMTAAGPGLGRARPWRVHFHVPIQAAGLDHPALTTTQPAILEVLDFLAEHPALHPDLEVETYTWQVLPQSLRPDDAGALQAGLAGELDWLAQAMHERGLLR
ncbi:MAG: metabolite traffic protein EboE [Chromatiaceae bacterium]|nr:metabolite traffic protein EboE [Chromatiaceae bacterium]